MRIFEQGIDSEQDILDALAAGSPVDEPEVEVAVRSIVEDVRARGDQALLELGRRFDSPALESVIVGASAIEQAFQRVDRSVLAALRQALENIRTFHEAEKQQSWFVSRGGSTLGHIVRPLDSVGLYVPGGRAAYPSTVLMTAVPAMVAGVPDIAVATPAGRDGCAPDAVLAACRLCDISRVYLMGGAQAVAALAIGTQSVQRVDKVVGPGNQYVNIAKRLLFGQVGIDSLAGPSEVLILADASSPPEWIAADLIAQAEHAGDSKAILITWSRALADRVLSEVARLTALEPRADLIRQALGARGAVVVVSGEEEALRLTNACAPEHLQILVAEPQEWIGKIRSAGAVFVGPYSPVPLGDYVAGPSHTLPTGTSARFSSALGVGEFQKRSSLIWYGRAEYLKDAPAAAVIASAEGLEAHRTSLEIRMKEEQL